MTQSPDDARAAVRRSRPASDWSKTLTQVVGREVKRHRTRAGRTLAALSRATEELSHPISRMAISNLEEGKRESVTVAELLVLADALDVPPVMLVAPAGYVEDVEPSPSTGPVATVEALRWLRGDAGLDFPQTRDLELVVALQAYLRADDLAGELAYLLGLRGRAEEHEGVVESLREVRSELREKRAEVRRYGLEPAPVPPSFGDLDRLLAGEPERDTSFVIEEPEQ